MAIAAIAGLATVGGAMAAAGTLAIGWAAGLTAFAIGAGLSIVSRALMPKPDFGGLLEGVTGTVREAASNRRIIYGKCRVGGSVVFIANSNENEYLYLVIAFAGHEIESYEEFYFNDELVWNTSGYQGGWGSWALINKYYGTQTSSDPTLTAASSFWTSTHQLNGVAYAMVRLKWDEERKRFPNGVPNISAVIKGKKVYDPRTNTTGYSNNPALCIRDYLTNTYYGLGEASANLNDTSFEDAADICDEAVSLGNGGVHARYACDGALDTGSQIKSNIEALLASMGGRLGYSGGQYFLQAAAYITPTINIDESVMVGELQVQTKQTRRGVYNGVKGVFLSEEENYTLCDYPAQISSTYATEDGDPIYLDMPLPFVTNNIRAQRLAKIALLKSRQQVSVTVPLNLAGLKLKAGDFITISNDRLGWTNKAFEVLDYTLSAGTDGQLSVNVSCVETASAVYDWTTSDEIDFNQPSTPTTNDGTTVAPPRNLSLTETSSITSDGTVVPEIYADWDEPLDGFVDRYELQVTNNTTSQGYFAYTRQTNYLITPVKDTDNYTVSVLAVNSIGVRSSSVSASLSPTGDTTAPSAPVINSTQGGYRSIEVVFTTPTERDTSTVEIYTAASFGGAYTRLGSYSVRPNRAYVLTNTNLGHGQTVYYKMLAVDNSDNASGFSNIVSGTSDAQTNSFTPREQRGYVYYDIASSSAPATPSVTSFNFSTGEFTGLTAGWSVDPPSQNGADGTFWASRYQVIEATYGGTQTIQFSTPFQSFVFNGLVTFVALNTELSTPGTGQVTTIDGGLINTGEIVLANGSGMAIRQGKFSPGLTGTGFWLGDSGSTAQFWLGDNQDYLYWDGSSLVTRNVVANRLEIRDGSNNVILSAGGDFDGAFISNATVDTLQIAGEAVMVPLSAGITVGTNLTVGTPAYSPVIGPITWTAATKPPRLLAIATVNFLTNGTGSGTPRTIALRVLRANNIFMTNAVVDTQGSAQVVENVSASVTASVSVDTSLPLPGGIGSGQYYQLEASCIGGTGTYKTVGANQLSIFAVKR